MQPEASCRASQNAIQQHNGIVTLSTMASCHCNCIIHCETVSVSEGNMHVVSEDWNIVDMRRSICM